MKNLFSIGLMAIGLIACGQKQMETDSKDAVSTANTSEALDLKDLYSDGRSKMIKTADCRYQVKNMKQSMEAIELAVKKYAAFVVSSNLELQNPMLEQRLTIRVSSEYFEDLLKEISLQAHFVNYQRVKSEDVAKEFVDLESRLRTKREVEQRYTEILRHKAGTIEELLKAEQQIGELHEEIEATISRINFLRDQVKYSTINLELYQVVEQQIAEVRPGHPMWKQVSKAFLSGWYGTTGVLIALAYVWPLLLMAGVVWIYFRFRKRKNLAV
jgi:hypothetical protein